MQALIWFQTVNSIQKFRISQIEMWIGYVHWCAWWMKRIKKNNFKFNNKIATKKQLNSRRKGNETKTHCIDTGWCFEGLLVPCNLPYQSMNYWDCFRNRHRCYRVCRINQLECLWNIDNIQLISVFFNKWIFQILNQILIYWQQMSKNVAYHLCRRCYGILVAKFGTNLCHKRI